MDIEKGQLWKDTKLDKTAFICEIEGDKVWYKIMEIDPFNRGRWKSIVHNIWQKANKELFIKRYEFTKHSIRSGTYWKNNATQERFTVHGTSSNGMDVVLVHFLMEQMPVEQFFFHHTPLTLMEQAEFIVENIKQPEPELPSRIDTIENED